MARRCTRCSGRQARTGSDSAGSRTTAAAGPARVRRAGRSRDRRPPSHDSVVEPTAVPRGVETASHPASDCAEQGRAAARPRATRSAKMPAASPGKRCGQGTQRASCQAAWRIRRTEVGKACEDRSDRVDGSPLCRAFRRGCGDGKPAVGAVRQRDQTTAARHVVGRLRFAASYRGQGAAPARVWIRRGGRWFRGRSGWRAQRGRIWGSVWRTSIDAGTWAVWAGRGPRQECGGEAWWRRVGRFS